MRIEYLFFGAFGLVVFNLLYHVVKHKGFRGAMFGAAIARTVGEMDLGRRGMVRMRLKVLTLEPSGTGSPEVGIEFVTTSVASWHMMPLPLSRSEAVTLSTFLSQAAEEVAIRK